MRSEYWDMKKVFERSLRREMYLGDSPDVRFELNLPRDKETWGGTYTCIGNSGAGKTYWVVQLPLPAGDQTPREAHSDLAEPGVGDRQDPEALKHKRFAFNVIGIDISEPAVRKSGMDAISYYKTKVDDVLESHGERAIVVMDDFPDGAKALYMLRKAFNTMLRTARHRITSVISLQHTYAGNRNTSQALQSNKFIVFFPRSPQNRCIMFLRDHLMLSVPEAKELVHRFAKLDRYLVIQLHSPVMMFNSKYLLLL